MNTLAQQLGRDTSFGFLDSRMSAGSGLQPMLISNSGDNTMSGAIINELRRANEFIFLVAFITPAAIAMLKQAILDCQGSGCIITSTYLGFNSPAAFRELLNLEKIQAYVIPHTKAGFHAKGYIFKQEGNTTAIIGSSNLTANALVKNLEWNLRFSALPEGDIVHQINGVTQEYLKSSENLTKEWVDKYEKKWSPPKRKGLIDIISGEVEEERSSTETIHPNVMQKEALAEIAALRDSGEKRGVVISATGTGKTILSALDVRAYAPERMLFIVHREQILDRAISEFKRVLGAPDSHFGKLAGGKQEVDSRYVFASIQTLSRPDVLKKFEPNAFNYILIDEVHRAGASSYRSVIDHFKPDFLLGMTATPERTDDFNVFELFDFNVPYEIRLQKALEAEMLAPFHYYGVTDFVMENGATIDQNADFNRLVAAERVDHLIKAITKYGHSGVPVRGLIFCSKNEEASKLSSLLNQREVHGKLLRTIALSGHNSIEEREQAVQKLEAGELDYIATVDIFNEGIDIPSVNQVIMLRQTQSSIVFTQQLGRGLRKAAGKDYLVVIDFIGNYENNYLIPIALFGDSSLNKDSIRKKLIDAQESGFIAGLSSVNFDAISKQRIFKAIADARLDSISNLKKSFNELKQRLGRAPKLFDFARFELVDPNVIATKEKNYWNFLCRIGECDERPGIFEEAVLTFLSGELLNGKRPHELLLLKELISNPGPLPIEKFSDLLQKNQLTNDPATLASILALLSLAFFTEAEVKKYGGTPLITVQDHAYRINDSFLKSLNESTTFNRNVTDVIETGIYIAQHSYQWSSQLLIGHRYSRKDVCRLLNWESNQQGTIFGYKVDSFSNTCPIFVTYHKDSDVSESTKYADEFLNPSTLTWFTRSRRTLASDEVKAIVENRLPLHIFAKKDDAEGTDFYYLGKATSQDARQTKMAVSELDVVSMKLHLENPIEMSLYEYFGAKI